MRLYNRDNREDIFELFYLVAHLIVWFIEPNFKKESDKGDKFVDEVKKMMHYMCIGLMKLQDTYKTGNVVLALQFYINLLRDSLNGVFTLDRLPACILEDLDIDTGMKNKIIGMWNYNRLHIVGDLYDNCFAELKKNQNKRNDIIDGYLLSIDSILSVYEKDFKNQLKQWGF